MFSIALVVCGPLCIALAMRGPIKNPLRDAIVVASASLAWNFVVISLRLLYGW